MSEDVVIPDALDGERLDRVVAMVSDLPRARAADLIAGGGVLLNGRVAGTRSTRLRAGDRLSVAVPPAPAGAPVEAEPDVPVTVVHEDGEVVVVDKQPGLVVHPGAGNERGTLVHGLLARFPDVAGAGDPARPGIVHRLDAGTSGLLVVARTPRAYESLVAQLAARSVERVYAALVLGSVVSPSGLVDAPIGRSEADPTRMAVTSGGRQARTRYEVVGRFREPVETTELECRLDTGRTHQIRVHLAAIGHPVAGDARYGGARPALPLRRPFLHAFALAFDHPATGERVRFTSDLPADLAAVRGALR